MAEIRALANIVPGAPVCVGFERGLPLSAAGTWDSNARRRPPSPATRSLSLAVSLSSSPHPPHTHPSSRRRGRRPLSENPRRLDIRFTKCLAYARGSEPGDPEGQAYLRRFLRLVSPSRRRGASWKRCGAAMWVNYLAFTSH